MKAMKLLLVGAMFLSTVSAAFAGPVFTLGQTALMDQKDVDVLTLGECREYPVFANKQVRAFKLVVTNRAAEIDKVVLTYGNGEKDELEIKEFFAAGEESRWINLPNLRGYDETRCIRKIMIKGDAETYVDSNAPRFQSYITFLGLK